MKKHYWFLPLLALCLTGCLNDKKMTTASSRASSNKNAHIITTKKNRNSSTHPTDPNRNNNPPAPPPPSNNNGNGTHIPPDNSNNNGNNAPPAPAPTPAPDNSNSGANGHDTTQNHNNIHNPSSTLNNIGIQPTNPFWGSNLEKAEISYKRAAELGVTWVRIIASWHRIQPKENGTYDWSDTDAAVQLAKKYGMKVLMQVSGTPEWASDANKLSNTEKEIWEANGMYIASFAPKAAYYADFAKFMGDVVHRYAPQGISNFEVWNEPGNPGFWHDSLTNPKPNPENYTHFLKLAYIAAHKANPNVNILAGGMTVGDSRPYSDGYISPFEFLNRMYAAGAKGYFDTLSHHPYGITGKEWRTNGWAIMYGDKVHIDLAPQAANEKTLYQIMADNGDAKEIWATEVGVPAMYEGLDEEKQANTIRLLLETAEKSKNYKGPIILYNGENDRKPYVLGIISQDANNDKILDVNIDTDNDGKPDANLDTDHNGKADALELTTAEDYFGLWRNNGTEKMAVNVLRKMIKK